ncbi:alpha-1,2-fucosyltransferase [Patescibacteria group bacterium]|nr:alpha-1,2-fucosyltransferase [Patescibacteria group bacterium]MBU4057622.1 alpha-1,2-fucosyltransferase [Patescibacteria group bacterium]MBU4115772.1 alpha-1,2-fucosyltransferase [Patescibacteria group bacterium]
MQLKKEFRLDITPFSTYYKADPYGLSKFNIQENIAKDSDMCGFIWIRKHNTFFSFIYHRLRFNKLLSPWYYLEKTFMYDPDVFSSKALYFEGFWQCEKYFKNIKNELRKEITLKNPLSAHSQDILKKIRETNAISLHVRRYASEHIIPWHGFCSIEYYIEAINQIVKCFPSPHFFIFSDNYPWVAENFLPVLKSLKYSFTLVENNNDKNGEDLILMSNCKHHIIANSSFGWWGAWLNPKKDKMVIAPKKWFAHAPKNNTKDLIPEEWITL